jgi:DNA polymerase-3 subunit chi
MTEILFYQIERQPLEQVLPRLLQLSLDRGWRAVVEADSEERVRALDAALWTIGDESFLPHGTAEDGNSELQPIFLTSGEENPNGAHVRFVIAGAVLPDAQGYERIVYLFEGRDEEALERARSLWKMLKQAGAEITYWQQDENGAWKKKA